MTMFFAPARRPAARRLERHLAGALPMHAANDNLAAADDRDRILRMALSHFAEHGLGAPRRAAEAAHDAAARGDVGDCRQWIAICRAFDRRLAIRTARQLGIEAG